MTILSTLKESNMFRFLMLLLALALTPSFGAFAQEDRPPQAVSDSAVAYFHRWGNEMRSYMGARASESLDSTRARTTFDYSFPSPFDGIQFFVFSYRGISPETRDCFYTDQDTTGWLNALVHKPDQLVQDTLLLQVNRWLSREKPLTAERFRGVVQFLLRCTGFERGSQARILQSWSGIDSDDDHPVPDSLKERIAPASFSTLSRGYRIEFYAWQPGSASLFRATVETVENRIVVSSTYLGTVGVGYLVI